MNQSKQSNNITVENKNHTLSPKYLQYIPYLYGNLIQLNCPSCKQRNSLVRSFDSDRNLWIIRCNQCNTVIELKKPTVIELENYKIRMMYNNENFMARILEIVHSNSVLQKKALLVDYQNKYRTNIQIAKKIHSILNDQQILIANQQSKQFELLKKMVENDVNRRKYYMKLKKAISLPQKKLLYQIYKNEKKPPANRLKDLEKEMKIPVQDIENWLEYFQYFSKYVETQNELNQISQEIAAQLKHFQEKNTNFFLSNESIQIIAGTKTPGAAARKTTKRRPTSAAAVPRITIKPETDSNVVKIQTPSPRAIAPANINNKPPTPNKPVSAPPGAFKANVAPVSATPAAPATIPKKKIVVKKQKGGNMSAHVPEVANKAKKITESYDFLDLLNNTSSEKLIKHKMIDLENTSNKYPKQIQPMSRPYANANTNANANIKAIQIDLPDEQMGGDSGNAFIQNSYKPITNASESNKELDKEQYREVVFH